MSKNVPWANSFFAYDNDLNMYQLMDKMGKEKFAEWLRSLSDHEADLLNNDPHFKLRPKQIIPDDGRLGTMALTSRGFGKNHMASVWCNQRAYKEKGPLLITGQTASDVSDTIVSKNPSSIIELAPKGFKPMYYPSKRLLVWPNGAIGFLRSGDEPEQLRGQNSGTVFSDELAKWEKLDESWSNMMFGLRFGDDPQYLIATTPRPKPLIKRLFLDDRCIKIHGSITENPELSPERVAEMQRMYEGTKLGDQELHGLINWDDERALWNRDMIENNRMPAPSNILQYVIAVDPTSGSGKKRNDEAGIVVVCSAIIDSEKHAFILDDFSLKGGPAQWSAAVKEALDKYPRAKIIAESNQGGEMVRQVLGGAGIPNGRIELKHHVRSKYDRAQPVALKAEQGLVHHTAVFSVLEDEMTSYTGEANEVSPNRLDAAVMGVHKLIVDNRPPLIVSRLGI
jgi:phage terminase large subunit-like protein